VAASGLVHLVTGLANREPPRGFSDAEYESRVTRAQELMAARDIDVLLLTTEPEVRYFSGFLTQFWQSPTRPWFLLVPASGKPVAVIPEIGAPLMARTWIDDVRSWPAPRPDDDGVSLLAETVAELGAASGRVGVLMGPETLLRMPLADYARLQGAVPHATFCDATDVLRTLRMVKSEAEIAKIAHVCGLGRLRGARHEGRGGPVPARGVPHVPHRAARGRRRRRPLPRRRVGPGRLRRRHLATRR
jgi:Xaa-Pro aminopeptidase